MVDRNTFMETLHSVQEIARVSDNTMDRETALSYFKDMELSPEQEEMVYQFLLLPPEETSAEPEESEDPEDAWNPAKSEAPEEAWNQTESEAPEKAWNQTEAVTGQTAAETLKANVDDTVQQEQTHFQMYLDEVEEIAELEAVTEAKLYQSLFGGDDSVIGALSTQWLKRVITIAEDYRDKGFLMDDLVQEGNIGLLMELHQMVGSQKDADTIDLAEISRQLRDAVKNAIELYLGEESGEEQQGETILAKVSLVHEAQKLLAEEQGEQPSLRQLAEYTRIPEEEISDILSFIQK